MANYALDIFSPQDMAEVEKDLARGRSKKWVLQAYEFSRYDQLEAYLDAYRSGEKWRFALRFYMKELEPILKGCTLDEAYRYCIDNGYTKRSRRRFSEVMREYHFPLKFAYKNRVYVFRGKFCNCSEIYAQVKGAFSRRTVYNFCKEHGYFNEYEAPEKRRRPETYIELVDMAVAFGYPYEQLRRMYIDGATLPTIKNFLKEAA